MGRAGSCGSSLALVYHAHRRFQTRSHPTGCTRRWLMDAMTPRSEPRITIPPGVGASQDHPEAPTEEPETQGHRDDIEQDVRRQGKTQTVEHGVDGDGRSRDQEQGRDVPGTDAAQHVVENIGRLLLASVPA